MEASIQVCRNLQCPFEDLTACEGEKPNGCPAGLLGHTSGLRNVCHVDESDGGPWETLASTKASTNIFSDK